MERELYGILTAIKDKTGIEIAVLSEDGVKEASTFSSYIPLDYSLIKSCGSDVLVDTENDKTYFKFVFNGIKYIGGINGSTKNENNYKSEAKRSQEDKLLCQLLGSQNDMATIRLLKMTKLILNSFSTALNIQAE